MAKIIKKCPECGERYEQDQPWKKTCLSCYLAKKERLSERRVTQLEEQIVFWKGLAQGDTANEVDKLSRRCEELNSALAGARLRITHLEIALTQAQAHPPRRPSPAEIRGTIPPEMLKRLIQLCHPDKHDGRESSIKATQWLLEQR